MDYLCYDVQTAINSINTCLLHINPRKKRELGHTVFEKGQLPKEEKMYLSDDAEKEEPSLLSDFINLIFFYMLEKKNRFTSNDLFKKVFQEGERLDNKLFSVSFRKNNLTFPRFAVIVSTKVSKSAVVRNKLKRRIRASLKEFIPVFKEGWDVVIISKKSSIDNDFAKIKEALGELLTRLS